MQVGHYDFSVKRGQDWSQVFTIVGYNLTAYTGEMVIRAHWTTDTLITLTNGNGLTLGNGTYTIALTDTQTMLLDSGKYVYDLKVTSGGNSQFLQEGVVTVNPSASV